MADGDVHVTPIDDLLDHEESGSDCACLPRVEAVKRDDGSMGWVIIHNSWDGRETRE